MCLSKGGNVYEVVPLRAFIGVEIIDCRMAVTAGLLV